MDTPPLGNCILHQGYTNRGGYGEVHKGLAHRVAYCKHHGVELASIVGRVVMHRCDNPPCVNPDHLALGTQEENMQDMHRKGRSVGNRGVSHLRELTADDVRAIRSMYVKGSKHFGTVALGRSYSTDPKVIHSIVKRKTYKEIL